MRKNTKQKVIALYNKGLSGPTIGKKLGIHIGTVYYHLKNIQKPNGGRQTKTDGDEVERLYLQEKLSCQQIADRLGLSNSGTVYTRLKKRGIKFRTKSEGMQARGLRKVGPDKEVVDKYQSGKSQTEISQEYSVTI